MMIMTMRKMKKINVGSALGAGGGGRGGRLFLNVQFTGRLGARACVRVDTIPSPRLDNVKAALEDTRALARSLANTHARGSKRARTVESSRRCAFEWCASECVF